MDIINIHLLKQNFMLTKKDLFFDQIGSYVFMKKLSKATPNFSLKLYKQGIEICEISNSGQGGSNNIYWTDKKYIIDYSMDFEVTINSLVYMINDIKKYFKTNLTFIPVDYIINNMNGKRDKGDNENNLELTLIKPKKSLTLLKKDDNKTKIVNGIIKTKLNENLFILNTNLI